MNNPGRENPSETVVGNLANARSVTSFLSGIDTGVAIFDKDFRLISANPAYFRLRGILPEQACVGTAMSEIMNFSLDSNEQKTDRQTKFEQSIEELVRVGKVTNEFTVHSGSRLRCVRNRGENLQTIELVSLIEDTDLASKHSTKNLEWSDLSSYRLLDAVSEMSEGFALFNAEGVLIALNERYKELSPHLRPVLFVGNTHEAIIRFAADCIELDQPKTDKEDFIQFALKERLNPGKPTVDRLADGRWIQFTGRKLEAGYTIFTQADVTDLKLQEFANEKASLALKETRKQLTSALDSMVQAYVMYDADNNLVISNKRYREMHNFPDHLPVEGRSRKELLEHCVENNTYTEAMEEQTTLQDDGSFSEGKVDQKKRYFSNGRVAVVHYHPAVNGGVVLTLHDITEQENAEKTLHQSNIKLQRSNDELQNFAYVASHDLQEPLRKIEAFGDRLFKKCGDQFSQDGQVYLDRILDASSRMRSLINDLLSFSRVTSSAKPFEPIDLDKVLEGVKSDIQMQLEDVNGLVESEGLESIDSDPTQMRQLFQNLISNALKFKKDDVDPIIKITGKRILKEDKFLGKTQMLQLNFSDNGIGFENRFKDQIFTIFQRLHGRLEYEGTGIGLSTCRKIVERHNGTIDAHGELGVGAVFTIELPLHQTTKENY